MVKENSKSLSIKIERLEFLFVIDLPDNNLSAI